MHLKWKLPRKAGRKKDKLMTFLMRPIHRIQQHNFDRKRCQHIEIIAGHHPLGRNVVVVVVYQPRGISDSLFHTLDNINSEGFSAFVVLNSHLSNLDQEKLKENCALVMKRPNFGYDFGGYRDAILHLANEPLTINSITCMNDSIWFPVVETCNHLSQMLNMPGYLTGYSHSVGVGEKHAHLQSYLFMFKGETILNSEAFLDYWSQLRLANCRHFTIRNSEMKMTAYFESKGYKANWLFSSETLIKFYEECNDQQVVAAVEFLNSIRHHSASLFDDTSKEDVKAQRNILIYGIKSGRLYRSIIGTEPNMLFHELNFAAMKKSEKFNYKVQRSWVLNGAASQRLLPCVRQELLNLRDAADDARADVTQA